MSSLIETASFEEMSEMMDKIDEVIDGMNIEQAVAGLGLLSAGDLAVNSLRVIGKSEGLISAASASEAFELYASGGGAISSWGSATATAGSYAPFTVIEGGGGAVASAGVLSMSLPAYAAALAPIAGFALGVGLYELSPEFWERISRALLPFCYPDTKVAPVVVDSNGQAYASRDAVTAIQRVIEELDITYKKSEAFEGLGVKAAPSIVCESNVYTYIFRGTGDVLFVDESNGGSDEVVYVHACSKVSGSTWYVDTYRNGLFVRTDAYATTTPATYQGMTVYHGFDVEYHDQIRSYPTTGKYLDPEHVTYAIEKILWIAQYGNVVRPVQGISQWLGNAVDYFKNNINVAKGMGSVTTPFVPLHIPTTPGISIDPETTPTPTVPNIPPEITPYIPPEVSPTQYPPEIPSSDVPDVDERTSPAKQPEKNPNKPSPADDPSVQPSEQPLPIPDVKPVPQPDPEPAPEEPDDPPPSKGEFPDITTLPTVDINTAGSGLIHVYNPTPTAMKSFGQWLWVTWSEASWRETGLLWSNPFDGVISAHELYATPETSGSDNIRSGFLTCPTTAPLVQPRYSTINCGSVVVPEFYGNYLDYSPYTKVLMYLPFVGVVPLECDDIIGHAVNVTYHVDAYSGAVVAEVIVAKEGYECLMYQFQGNCAVELPLSGGNMASVKAGLLTAAGSALGSIVSGVAQAISPVTTFAPSAKRTVTGSGRASNVLGGIGSAISGLSSAAYTAASQKATVQHSGAFGANSGAMAVKRPYLIVKRPVQKVVVNYNEDYGIAAHKRVVIGTCSGFLKCKDVHVKLPTATDDEKDAITEALKNGVFV